MTQWCNFVPMILVVAKDLERDLVGKKTFPFQVPCGQAQYCQLAKVIEGIQYSTKQK